MPLEVRNIVTAWDMTKEASAEIDVGENQNGDVEHRNIGENLENVDDEDGDIKGMRLRFMEILHKLTPTKKRKYQKKRAFNKDQEDNL